MTDLSSGLLALSQFGYKERTDAKVPILVALSYKTTTKILFSNIVLEFQTIMETYPLLSSTTLSSNIFFFPPIHTQASPATVGEDNVQSEGDDSDHFNGSNSSFLANEKLMSVDSMNSDITGVICLYLLDFLLPILPFIDFIHS